MNFIRDAAGTNLNAFVLTHCRPLKTETDGPCGRLRQAIVLTLNLNGCSREHVKSHLNPAKWCEVL